jgi:hypothetical protein
VRLRRGVLALALLAPACGGGATATVTAADYRFDNLPATVGSGTRLGLRNASATEIHEMVVARLPDTETRSAEALVRLPAAQLDQLLTGSTVAVLLRPPGGAGLIRALGDGKLTGKGRYLVVCTIPIGADPAAVLATRGPKDAPPVAGGAPHFTRGMYGEIRVE